MTTAYTLRELADLLSGNLHGDAALLIQGVSSLVRAQKNQIACFDNTAQFDLLSKTRAGAVLLAPQQVRDFPFSCISVPNPWESIHLVANLFKIAPIKRQGIHQSAIISPTAELPQHVFIDAHAMIGERVVIAPGVCVGAHCVIEKDVFIGAQTIIEPGAVIGAGTVIGAQTYVGSGVVIGANPFNNLKDKGYWHTSHALGGTVIGDRVLIGANTVIARGSLSDTCIGENVCIDNLVHIAHDVTIGAHTAIAGCAVIGAFVRIGGHCVIGGASCIAANVHLANEVVITGMSTVSKSLQRAGVYSSGTLVSEHQRWRRNAARFRRLDDYVARLAKLEKKGQDDSMS
ncbi:UDP-3-O-[3-hydroxymyristoyl] glucosamine N-acyltransferase [Legionella rubrilucens]|uniref:UDP-3-O-[3-hydroxymyristoyl] glucosamine N-acyltransferase n=1 Tax=Legionella rubrilucens TaxID=458 RepID=A0A0W0XUH7_9GAMM|nr:UDP-3-O-(3-hydroxymyristoyl)glucosamine N-acyltransferase [Legionella rubrilucens]KTD48525.1 UDP-3-O-[3-hydroxymyristoyl] glucosamine N-acyltransferase [Legionella rubrilucens]